MELKGKLILIGDIFEKEGSDFRKREVVIETDGNYPQQLKFEFINDRIAQISEFKLDDYVEIEFSIRGRKYNDKYYTDLRGFEMKKLRKKKTETVQEKPVETTKNETTEKQEGKETLPWD